MPIASVARRARRQAGPRMTAKMPTAAAAIASAVSVHRAPAPGQTGEDRPCDAADGVEATTAPTSRPTCLTSRANRSAIGKAAPRSAVGTKTMHAAAMAKGAHPPGWLPVNASTAPSASVCSTTSHFPGPRSQAAPRARQPFASNPRWGGRVRPACSGCETPMCGHQQQPSLQSTRLTRADRGVRNIQECTTI
jgi:hypothetical protein